MVIGCSFHKVLSIERELKALTGKVLSVYRGAFVHATQIFVQVHARSARILVSPNEKANREAWAGDMRERLTGESDVRALEV